MFYLGKIDIFIRFSFLFLLEEAAKIMGKVWKNIQNIISFFGSIFGGSRGRFWEAFGEDFGGPGRLLGGKMGEKREQK